MKEAPPNQALMSGSKPALCEMCVQHGDTGGPADRGCPLSLPARRTSVGIGFGQPEGWKLCLPQNF